MSIDFQCPNCQAELHAPDEHAGGSATCERCATRVRIPAPGTSSPPPEGLRSDHTIEVACPGCKKRFPVELGELAPDKNLLVACDHCGVEKKLAAFQKELDRQLRLAQEEERTATIRRAKHAEKLRREEENDRFKQERRDQWMRYQEVREREMRERERERANRPRDPHGRTLVPPSQTAPRYSGIRQLSILYKILALLTFACGVASMVVGVIKGVPIVFVSGLGVAISGILVYGIAEVFAAFRDMAINSYLALSPRE